MFRSYRNTVTFNLNIIDRLRLYGGTSLHLSISDIKMGPVQRTFYLMTLKNTLVQGSAEVGADISDSIILAGDIDK